MDDIPEYDERLLVCQECDGDFIYTVDEQKRDEKENKQPPQKCHRCMSGGHKPQRDNQQTRSGPRSRGRDDGGRGRGRGRGRDPFREEYRSPSFRNQQPDNNIYRSPAFSGSDPARNRDRASSGGGRPRDRSQGSRQRFQITCSKCGRQDTIPFRPSPNRPVFCHECYESQRLEDRKGR